MDENDDGDGDGGKDEESLVDDGPLILPSTIVDTVLPPMFPSGTAGGELTRESLTSRGVSFVILTSLLRLSRRKSPAPLVSKLIANDDGDAAADRPNDIGTNGIWSGVDNGLTIPGAPLVVVFAVVVATTSDGVVLNDIGDRAGDDGVDGKNIELGGGDVMLLTDGLTSSLLTKVSLVGGVFVLDEVSI
jgi:hypothetical protein